MGMLFSSRVRLKDMAGLCRRLSISLEAGIDARTIWQRETDRATGHLRRNLLSISKGANCGETLADALTETGDFFPSLFREMVQVGEQTGHLDGVLRQLADNYDDRLRMRRNFLRSISWPMVELGLSLTVIGILIWVMGFLPNDIDILGFGLKGDRGLQIYVTFLAACAAVIWLAARAVSRGMMWIRPVQRIVLQLPVIGKPLQTMALARLAWSMHLTMNTGMEVRRALRLSLRSTQSARYLDHIPKIEAEITAGSSIHEAFVAAGGYPADFLDTLAVGEESGKIVDSMGNLARQYHERAQSALSVLTEIAGYAVMAVVGAIIIVMIFRVFSFYLNAISDAMPK